MLPGLLIGSAGLLSSYFDKWCFAYGWHLVDIWTNELKHVIKPKIQRPFLNRLVETLDFSSYLLVWPEDQASDLGTQLLDLPGCRDLRRVFIKRLGLLYYSLASHLKIQLNVGYHAFTWSSNSSPQLWQYTIIQKTRMMSCHLWRVQSSM